MPGVVEAAAHQDERVLLSVEVLDVVLQLGLDLEAGALAHLPDRPLAVHDAGGQLVEVAQARLIDQLAQQDRADRVLLELVADDHAHLADVRRPEVAIGLQEAMADEAPLMEGEQPEEALVVQRLQHPALEEGRVRDVVAQEQAVLARQGAEEGLEALEVGLLHRAQGDLDAVPAADRAGPGLVVRMAL